MKFRLLLAASICIGVLAGCVSTRPLGKAGQLASEERVTLIEKSRMFIFRVDDAHRGYGFVESFQITPGMHTIIFRGTTGDAINIYLAEVKLSYDFQPGHTYVIQDAPLGSSIAVQIVDQASDQELRPLGGL